MVRPNKTCRGLLHFRCVQGMLIHVEGVCEARCSKCGEITRTRRMPSQGARCGKPNLVLGPAVSS